MSEFDKKKLGRQLDELEHKFKCMMERRNRLIKELGQLQETNQVYNAIDNEIYGGDSDMESVVRGGGVS